MDEYSEYHKVIFSDYRSPRSIKQILFSGQLEIYFIAMKCIYNTNWPILNLDVNETVSNCRITVCVFKNNMTKCIRCIRRNRIDIFGIIFITTIRSSRPDVFCKKSVLKNFAKFTGKHLCQSLFFNKIEGLRPATLLKKRLWHRCFPANFAKFL